MTQSTQKSKKTKPFKIIFLIFLLFNLIPSSQSQDTSIILNQVIYEINNGTLFHSVQIPKFELNNYLFIHFIDTGSQQKVPVFYASKSKLTEENIKSAEWTTENKNATSIIIPKENVNADDIFYIGIICDKCSYKFEVKLILNNNLLPHFMLNEM